MSLKNIHAVAPKLIKEKAFLNIDPKFAFKKLVIELSLMDFSS